MELSLRGILRGFGLKLGKVTRRGFETRVRELVANHPTLQHITRSMLLVRATLQREHNILHKALLKIVRRDNVCRQLMTAPGVGPIVAITYKTAIDDPRGSAVLRGTPDMKVVPTCENNVRLAIQEEIGKGLRSYYDEVMKEGIPGCLIDLVGRLEETDKACSAKQE